MLQNEGGRGVVVDGRVARARARARGRRLALQPPQVRVVERARRVWVETKVASHDRVAALLRRHVCGRVGPRGINGHGIAAKPEEACPREAAVVRGAQQRPRVARLGEEHDDLGVDLR